MGAVEIASGLSGLSAVTFIPFSVISIISPAAASALVIASMSAGLAPTSSIEPPVIPAAQA